MNLSSSPKYQKETAVITTTARVTAREARPRRITSTLLWAVQIVLAAFFLLVAALPKLAGSHSSVQEFGLIGAGQWFRYLVGTLELAGAIGLLTPWLAGLAAAGLAADMAGATIINATVLTNTTYGVNVWMTALLCVAFVLLAYGRRQQIKGLAATIRRVKNAGRRARPSSRS
jgi:putative oxidoreductase